MPHTKDKWVIIFLIYADFRNSATETASINAFSMTEQMKVELNSMFKDILTVPIDSSRARMYVIMNSIDYKEEGSLKTAAKTILYRIDNPNHLRHNQITSCRIITNDTGDCGTPNPGNPIQNPEFLKNIVKGNILVDQDEEVFFITWDHGSAFGIFREVDLKVARILTPIYHDLSKYPYLAEFWNKALKEECTLNKLIKRANHKNHLGIFQIGHVLYRLKANSKEQCFLRDFNFFSQNEIKVNRTESLTDAPKFILLYNTDEKEFEITNDISNKDLLKLKKGDLTDIDVKEILSNDELAIIFQDWLGEDNKVGVLLMMNCWMMNLHTMYSLRETVKCLVAPQGKIGAPGYNYKDILKYLFSNISFFKSSEELAIKCVTTVENKRMRRRSRRLRDDEKDMIDKWKIFAVDLQRQGDNGLILMDHLNKINQFVDKLVPKSSNSKEIQELISLYKSIRLVSFDFTLDGSFGEMCFIIDIINWFNVLTDIALRNPEMLPTDHDNLLEIKGLVNQVRPQNGRKHLVLKESMGKEIYNYHEAPAGSDQATVGFHPTGYGLFFPNKISANQNLISNVRNDSLLQTFFSNWRKFIQLVYDKKIWQPFFDQ